MKKLMFFLLLFIAAIIAGVLMSKDPGYALFAYQYWTVQMPLWVAGILLIIVFLVLHNIALLIRGTSALAKRFSVWRMQRQQVISHKLTKQGLLELAEGKWQEAERYLTKATEHNSAPLINYLAAAAAAQEQGAYERRDEYLTLAHESTPGSEIAVGLTQAQLQMNHKQLEHSLATLRHLQHIEPRHEFVLKLLLKLYTELKDWQGLVEILPEIKQQKLLKPEEFTRLEIQVYSDWLSQLSHKKEIEKMLQVWQSIPKNIRKSSQVLTPYLQGLIEAGLQDEAEQLAREQLKINLDNDLVVLYSTIYSSHPDEQLQQAEHWLKIYGGCPGLYLCLGRLCVRNQLWGKARAYLQQCIDLEANSQAYAELGKLLEFLGEKEAALKCYKQGLLGVVDKTEVLPL